MEDLRKSVRYAVNRTYSGNVEIELRGVQKLRCGVIDLSSSGLSFEAKDYPGDIPDGIIDGEDFFITLYINEINLLAGVEKIWSVIKESDDGKMYSAGLKFKMLADEDRLKLNSSIERIRKSVQAAARNGSRI